MKLNELPVDILTCLPGHLHSPYKFYSLISTCRLFYNLYGSPHAYPYEFTPILPISLMSLYPHLLIAGTARQIGDWAGQSKENDDKLYACLARGNDGLVELASKVASLTLAQIRELYRFKTVLLLPLSIIEGAEVVDAYDPFDVYPGFKEVILNQWIYDDLFHAFPDEILGTPHNNTIELRTRYRWVAMCMPDDDNSRNLNRSEGDQHSIAHTVGWLDSSMSVGRRMAALQHYFQTGILREWTVRKWKIEEDLPTEPLVWHGDDSDDSQRRKTLSFRLATSLGIESLYWLLPGYITSNHNIIEHQLQHIRDAVANIPSAKIMSWFSESKNPRSNGWIGWSGLRGDMEEARETWHWSEEELSEDVRRMDRMRFEKT